MRILMTNCVVTVKLLFTNEWQLASSPIQQNILAFNMTEEAMNM